MIKHHNHSIEEAGLTSPPSQLKINLSPSVSEQEQEQRDFKVYVSAREVVTLVTENTGLSLKLFF